MIKTIVVDEEGYFVLQNGVRLTDESVGREMLKKFTINDFGVVSFEYERDNIVVEAFDKPYVAAQVHNKGSQWQIQLPYQLYLDFDVHTLCLDDWDRFHGLTNNGIPFVLSRKAQAELFNLATDFTDDSIQLGNETIKTGPYFLDNTDANLENYWTRRYKEEAKPGWNLDQPHPELVSTLPQLKLLRQQILVAGCGYGHDAAFLAELGHIVTAIDFSQTAIDSAKARYGHIKNLTFKQEDFFNLSSDYSDSFDLVFEHTFFCAINPDRRKDIIKIWNRCLREKGHILGIFFVQPKRMGPPFGGSEWELRSLLEKKYQFLYWTRLKFSPSPRNGTELILYAQKK